MENIKGLKKQVNVALNYDDIVLVDKLRRTGIIKGYTDIFRVGLRKLQEDTFGDLTQNNVS